MMRCKMERPLAAAWRSLRRMSPSSALAVSAMVSSSRMAERIFSSKYLLVWRPEKKRSMAVGSPVRPTSYSLTRREAVSTPATSSSSRVLSMPPWSAR